MGEGKRGQAGVIAAVRSLTCTAARTLSLMRANDPVLDDLKEVVVEKAAEQGTYDEFLQCLPADEPRYAVFDFEYEKPGEGMRNKITFFAW